MSHKNPYRKYLHPENETGKQEEHGHAHHHSHHEHHSEQAQDKSGQSNPAAPGDLVDEPHGMEQDFVGSTLNDTELHVLAQARLCPSCPTFKEAEDTRLRLLADLDNSRKRLNREKEDIVRFAAEGVISDIIPAIDNLDLAIKHAQGQEACKNFLIGVEMTRKMLLESLAKRGLQTTGMEGETFDPSHHEAVGVENSPEMPNDCVVNVYSKGYKLHDRLLRAAKVIVNKI